MADLAAAHHRIGARHRGAGDLAEGLEVRADAMARHLEDPLGLIHAEALSFALAPTLGRAQAQARSRRWPPTARATGHPAARARGPRASRSALPDLTAPAMLGTAPQAARAFARPRGRGRQVGIAAQRKRIEPRDCQAGSVNLD
jgi:hypothetical protein